MKPRVPKRWVAELLLAVVAAGWGIGFPVMKMVVNTYPVMMVLGLRFWLSAFFLLPFSLNEDWEHYLRQTFLSGLLLGLLLGTSFVFLYLWSSVNQRPQIPVFLRGSVSFGCYCSRDH